MRATNSRSSAGFSLIEVMIYTVTFLVILAGVLQMLNSNRAAYLSGTGRLDAQQNSRVSTDDITRYMRMAGYYPENFDANAGNDQIGVHALQVATDDAVAILTDGDGSGTSEVILFCLDGTDLRRLFGANAVAASYTCSNGDVLAENISSFRLTYYDSAENTIPADPTPPFQLDGEGLGSVPLYASTAERDAVRRVVVAVTVTAEVPGQKDQIYTLTSDARFRNLN